MSSAVRFRSHSVPGHASWKLFRQYLINDRSSQRKGVYGRKNMFMITSRRKTVDW